MKRIIKITLIALVIAIAGSLVGCSAVERLLFGGDPYSFSDVVLTQTGINEYRIEFTANCGRDDVDIYFTEGFRLQANSKPREVQKSVDGKNVRFAFTASDLNLAEDYYVWIVSGDKQARTSVTIPCLFPSLTANKDGGMDFNFNFTYGTSWSSFCDEKGKAIYKSAKPMFDSSATLILGEIDMMEESVTIPAEQFDKDSYYFAVINSKEGAVKSVSSPVMIYDSIISQVTGMSAKLTNDLHLQVDISIPETSAVASSLTECLQLMVKTDVADEIKLSDCTYANGVATMSVDLSNLYFDGIWYDVMLVWRGAVVMDVPQYFGTTQVNTVSTIKKESIVYNIVGWKPENAPEYSEMLKVYFEEDTTKYADNLVRSYLVTFTVDPVPTLNVTVKLKAGETEPPVLAITGGDKVKLASVSGTKNEDGSYSYSLPVGEALTEAGKWYDLRFFVGNNAYEMYKDSCITYDDFAADYTSGTKVYEFCEWNGFLKLMYTDTAAAE